MKVPPTIDDINLTWTDNRTFFNPFRYPSVILPLSFRYAGKIEIQLTRFNGGVYQGRVILPLFFRYPSVILPLSSSFD